MQKAVLDKMMTLCLEVYSAGLRKMHGLREQRPEPVRLEFKRRQIISHSPGACSSVRHIAALLPQPPVAFPLRLASPISPTPFPVALIFPAWWGHGDRAAAVPLARWSRWPALARGHKHEGGGGAVGEGRV